MIALYDSPTRPWCGSSDTTVALLNALGFSGTDVPGMEFAILHQCILRVPTAPERQGLARTPFVQRRRGPGVPLCHVTRKPLWESPGAARGVPSRHITSAFP